MTTVNFDYTGSAQSWTVPVGVEQINVLGYGSAAQNTGGDPGSGAGVTATIPVTPGHELGVYVGGNAGVFGGVIGYTGAYSGDATALVDVTAGVLLLVAAGGGEPGYYGVNGGVGGQVGQAGEPSGTGGAGATQSAGANGPATAATPYAQGGTPAYEQGAGGAGFYGGYGGTGAGPGVSSGGGGSSWVTPDATDIDYYAGVDTGTGSLTISYTASSNSMVMVT